MIRIENLSYTYTGTEKAVLQNLNFHIERGTIFGFLGPSGAGKSTTQKILMGLLDNHQGSIHFEDDDFNPGKPDFYEKIGIAFDIPRFYKKMTGRENLQFFAKLYKCKTRNIMELLGSVDLADAADKKVRNYSKGMTVRLNLCRALLHNPPLLFLDEPTSGLDPALSRKVRDIIEKEKQEGKTIFLTTHSMETAAELCDKVAFLVDGRIALCDSPVSLMHGKGMQKVRICYATEDREYEIILPLNSFHREKRFLEIMKTGKILSIHSLEENLNDIFIEVTGRPLNETESILS